MIDHLVVRDPESWSRITAEARAQKLVELAVREATPLVFGEPIAWVNGLHGLTDSLSPVHRVGYPQKDEPYTTCGESIPHPVRWMALSPALARSMDRCRFCEAELQRAHREQSHAA